MFSVSNINGRVSTDGLAKRVGFDVFFELSHDDFGYDDAAASNLMRFLATYFEESRAALVDGEKVEWGSSLLVARQVEPKRFRLDELEFDGVTVTSRLDQCVRTWDAQSRICQENSSRFRPATFGSLVATSPQALSTSGEIEGVRYPSPPHMSGWWLFESDYDGARDGFKSMKNTHVSHVLTLQQRLAPLLALDVGFAFKLPQAASECPAEVWFEEDAARRPIP